jgi:hypothetical protein
MMRRCNETAAGFLERFRNSFPAHSRKNRAARHRRFCDHAECDAYLVAFVADYKRTRLQCLCYSLRDCGWIIRGSIEDRVRLPKKP